MHVVMFTESISNNSLGRTYCLWELCQVLGWRVTVLAARGEEIWGPARGSRFADDVHLVDSGEICSQVPSDADMLIACKPVPETMAPALRVAKHRGLPLIVDIDDPDLEMRLRVGQPLMRLARWIRYPNRMIVDLRNLRRAKRLPTFVSNPWLEDRYGGTLVPHVRPDRGEGVWRESADVRIVFVGTNRPHKGVNDLRAAVRELQNTSSKIELVITDNAPPDAQPWEQWAGQTTLDQGFALVRNADLVVLPSLAVRGAVGQLPAKLVDAMMFGRALVVTDVPPMPWAVGENAIVVPAGSMAEIREAIGRLRDPYLRRKLGDGARRRALNEFSIDAVAPRFRAACEAAIGQTKEG